MVKNPTVFIADDYILNDNFKELEEELLKRDIKVIRGPKTYPGMKLKYEKKDYPQLFSDAHVLMFSSRSICDKEIIDYAKNAIAYINPTCGMETVDLEEITKHEIIAGNGPIPENVNSVAEATICAMMMLSHQTMRSINCLKNNSDRPTPKNSWSTMLCGKKVGFIGFGNIGRATAERLSTFGVEMLAYSPHLTKETAPPYVKVCSLEEVLKESDYVGIYVVINKSTYHMINKQTISMMKPTAYLINTARGDAVDEDDLYEALKNKVIAGAALDTFHIEPLPVTSKLRELDNVILTPHMAGATIDNYRGITQNALKNVLQVLDGKLPVYCKNPQIADQWMKNYKNRKDLVTLEEC